jgi:hypothetical protein
LSFIAFQYGAPGKGLLATEISRGGTVSRAARHHGNLRFAQEADPKSGMRVS